MGAGQARVAGRRYREGRDVSLSAAQEIGDCSPCRRGDSGRCAARVEVEMGGGSWGTELLSLWASYRPRPWRRALDRERRREGRRGATGRKTRAASVEAEKDGVCVCVCGLGEREASSEASSEEVAARLLVAAEAAFQKRQRAGAAGGLLGEARPNGNAWATDDMARRPWPRPNIPPVCILPSCAAAREDRKGPKQPSWTWRPVASGARHSLSRHIPDGPMHSRQTLHCGHILTPAPRPDATPSGLARYCPHPAWRKRR